jgi:hypothetical protein
LSLGRVLLKPFEGLRLAVTVVQSGLSLGTRCFHENEYEIGGSDHAGQEVSYLLVPDPVDDERIPWAPGSLGKNVSTEVADVAVDQLFADRLAILPGRFEASQCSDNSHIRSEAGPGPPSGLGDGCRE